MLNSAKCTVFPKAIRRIKVALTTKCNIDCGYCFIHCPTSDMSWPVAKAAVDLLMGSIQEEKLLSCYGGEPLLQFSLLKEVVIYARSIENENNKKLTIACCTNSLLLTDEHLSFFKAYDVRVHVSLFGHEQDNDEYRARGFKKVIANIAKSSVYLGALRTSACVCVTPRTVRYLKEDILTIIQQTGTRVVTIEPIIELEAWSMDDVAVFIEQMRLVCRHLIDSVKLLEPIFLNALCWRLYVGGRRQKRSSNVGYDQCPFLGSLDVSPTGDIAFSPFVLYGKKEKRGVIGNVLKVKGQWWEGCSFERESKTCLDCYANYFAFGGVADQSHFLINYMDALVDETVRILQALAVSDERYGKYIEEARNYAS